MARKKIIAGNWKKKKNEGNVLNVILKHYKQI